MESTVVADKSVPASEICAGPTPLTARSTASTKPTCSSTDRVTARRDERHCRERWLGPVPIPDSPGQDTLLALRGVSKNFGPVHALTEVNLDILPGQVTALVGDNGAGKSTLIKAIAGIHQPTTGEIFWNGEQVHIRTPRDADRARHRDRVPGPRALRQPRHRPEHVPRPRAAEAPTARRDRDGADRAADARGPLGHHRPVDPPAGRVPLRRSAPGRRRREGRDARREARHHGRADRRPRRVADGAGARAHSTARRRAASPCSSSRTT